MRHARAGAGRSIRNVAESMHKMINCTGDPAGRLYVLL
jgi:hypothetical protein